MTPHLLDRLHILEEGSGSSGLIPQGDDGSRDVGYRFGDLLLPKVSGSG